MNNKRYPNMQYSLPNWSLKNVYIGQVLSAHLMTCTLALETNTGNSIEATTTF